MSLFSELQRRNVFRVTVAYVVSAWLLAQVADLVLDNITAPDWVMQTILLVLLLGLAPVVFFSWAYEVTPEGIKREAEVDRSASITHVTRRKLDRTITFVLVLAVAYFAADKFLLSPAQLDTQPTDNSEIIETSAGDNTIAVLPFVNMSDDEQNEYFSDGLSEELLNVLAKNAALQVAARTSSFSLKGEKLEIREIAERLNVDHVLEGSVRKSGNQVRITAQLIRADNGYHLWSDTYDRSLENIFEVQDEIAAKITAALLPHVVGEAVDDQAIAAVSGYEPPAEAYQDYLLARNYFNQASRPASDKAHEILEALVREHPGYAEAQTLYAHVTFWRSRRTGGDTPWIITEAQVRGALETASALKPDIPEIYLVEGLLHARSRDPEQALEFFERAIELNPSYAEAYQQLSLAAMDLGLTTTAWEALETALALDPISIPTLGWVHRQATEYDRPEMATNAMRVLTQVSPQTADIIQVLQHWDDDRVAEAAIALEDFRVNWPDEDPHDRVLARMYAALGKTEEAMEIDPRRKPYIAAELGLRELALSAMEEVAATRTDPHDRADAYWITYLALGMKDEALEVLSELWYGYAAEDLGPRMDYNDLFTLVELLRHSGRADEAAPLAEILIEQTPLDDRDGSYGIRMLEGRYEEALALIIEKARNGEPPVAYTRTSPSLFMLEDLPDYALLENLIQDWRKEQRALYDELSAARVLAEDTAHP